MFKREWHGDDEPDLYPRQPLFDHFLLAVGFAFSQQMVLRCRRVLDRLGFACIGACAVASWSQPRLRIL